MYVMILVFCVVAVTVNIIRNKEMYYAFEIAILTGGILNVILLLLTNYFVKIDTKMFALLAGTALSVVLVWMIQFMRLALNYAHKQIPCRLSTHRLAGYAFLDPE